MSEKETKVGRSPVVLTDEQIVQIEALAARLSIEQIADYLGISSSKFHELKNEDERISGVYKKGKAKAIDDVANSLIQKALEGDSTCMLFYLKTQAGWKESKADEDKIKHTTHLVLTPQTKVREVQDGVNN